MNNKSVSFYFILTLIYLISFKGYSQYRQVTPRDPVNGEIAVSKAGNLDVSGATYILDRKSVV